MSYVPYHVGDKMIGFTPLLESELVE